MISKKTVVIAATALMAMMMFSSSALASPQCTDKPESKWLSEKAMKSKIKQMGYGEIKIFRKTASGCYEIYGYTGDGHRAEVYFNPIDGSVVEKNVD
ncbi:hypothetical protein BCL93_10534 [Onishia taeanensis]|uniref:PepSY domain-containing protein n=2 Tax=Onishia taeanensis TaxID=284577 RepID=A0A328XVX3_9GAMM|nr:hypothetical protein BCL93_10534 [Halomonas taeanensis]